jgi:hypothetical protein
MLPSLTAQGLNQCTLIARTFPNGESKSRLSHSCNGKDDPPYPRAPGLELKAVVIPIFFLGTRLISPLLVRDTCMAVLTNTLSIYEILSGPI